MALPKPVTSQNIAQFDPLEYILMMGPASTGKTYSILKMAEAWDILQPEGKIYIVDVETGMAKTFKELFSHLQNVNIWHGDDVDNIYKFLGVFKELAKIVTPKDWLILESDTRIWAAAQDAGYAEITGMSKDEFLSSRLANGIGNAKGGVTPHPDQLWQVVLDLYRRQFRDVLTNSLRLKTNIIVTAGVGSKSPNPSATQKATMKLLGIDVVPDGHGESARNADTVVLLSKEINGYTAEILKDRGHDMPGKSIKFGNTDFWWDFTNACRGARVFEQV